MSRLTEFAVAFRKQVSDGNYGTEAAEVTLHLSVAADAALTVVDSTQLEVGLWLHRARDLVHEELAQSPNGKVRWAVAGPVAPGGPAAEPGP